MQVVAVDEDYEAIRLRQALLMNENLLEEYIHTIVGLVRQLQVMQYELRRQVTEMRRALQRLRDVKW
jgi:hypothetical protein